MKPINTKMQKVRKTRINDYLIGLLEIDMKHINYGLDESREYNKEKRSNITAIKVGKFFESLDGIELVVESDNSYDYFTAEKKYYADKKVYKIVFCIERDKPETSGIITMFQIAEE